MSPAEKYTWLRQAGFTHEEATRFINKAVLPNRNTELKRKAIERLLLVKQ